MEPAGKGGKAVREKEAKKERSKGHNPEECPVCMTVFNGIVQRPRTLPCGHTVCTLCVNKLKKQGHVTCPECCVSHAEPEGGQFPVSYTIEALLRRRGAEAAAAGQKEAAGLSSKMRSFLQKHYGSVMAAITTYQEVQTQLDQYQTTLRGWGEKQQQLEDRLRGLLDLSKSAGELVRQEESRAAAKKEEAREGEGQLQAALEALRTPGTEQKAHVAAEVFRCTLEAKEMLEECRGSFPDVYTAATVRKVNEASNAAVDAFQAALEAHSSVAEDEALPQFAAECTIEGRLQAILTLCLKEPLQAEDLRSPTQPVNRLLEARRVFGVHEVDGQHRYARISLESGRVYLHTLKEGPLPPFAKAIQVSQMVPPSPPCTVFLDLSWPGSAPRRVHVRLWPDTKRGRQMMLLCTGQRGPSHAGTRLLEVVHKNVEKNVLDLVRGGDYESNDGEGGAALLPDLDASMCVSLGHAGCLMKASDDPAKGAQFLIATKKWGPGYTNVFGEVIQGLDTVVAAAEHTNIKEVTIKDCGVVFWE